MKIWLSIQWIVITSSTWYLVSYLQSRRFRSLIGFVRQKDKVSCYQLKHYNFFMPTFAFHPLALLLSKKVSYWCGHMDPYHYGCIVGYCLGGSTSFSMPTKVTYQIVLLLRLSVWKHDNLHIGVKVVNTKYLHSVFIKNYYCFEI